MPTCMSTLLPNASRLVAFCALLTASTVYADAKKMETLEQMQAFAEGVVKQSDTDSAKAFELIKAHVQGVKDYSTLTPADIDATAQRFIAYEPQRLTQVGKPTGNVELVGKTLVGKNLAHFTYLQHRARYPLVWTFDAYRTAGGWTLTGFNVDSDAGPLLNK